MNATRYPDTRLYQHNTRVMARGMKLILESQTMRPVPVRIDESEHGADVIIGPFRNKMFSVQLWFNPARRTVDARACLEQDEKKSCRTLNDVPLDALTSPARLFPWLTERLKHHNADAHIERLIAETPSLQEEHQAYKRSLKEFRDVHQPITRYTAQMFGIESLLDKDEELAGKWHEGTPAMIPVYIPPAAMFTSQEHKQKVQVILVTRLHTNWIYDPTGGRRQNFMGKAADQISEYRPRVAQRGMVAANGMLRRFLIGGPYRLAVDTVQSERNGTLTVYISAYAPGDATHPELKAAAIQALEEMLRQLSFRGTIYRNLVYGVGGDTLPRIAAVIEADWRNDRLRFDESRGTLGEITLTEADAWMKHCIAKVYAKHQDLPRAFAICTAHAQKLGYYKPGTKEPTKAGKTRARSKAAKKGHRDVLTSYEQAKVAARKLRRRAKTMQ